MYLLNFGKNYSVHAVISTEASPKVYLGRAKWRNPSMLSFRLERAPRLRSGQATRAKWRNPFTLALFIN